jgi:uncharacterized protein (TIGR03437 family)
MATYRSSRLGRLTFRKQCQRACLFTCATVWCAIGSAQPFSYSFLPPVTAPVKQGPVATVSADFNTDGYPDLAVANGGASSVTIFLGNGDGTFTNTATVSIPNQCFVDSLTAGDFNNDGKVDLLAVCGFQTSVWVLPGMGNGQFGAPVSSVLPQDALNGFAIFSYHSVAVADFNRDGKLDLVLDTADTLENTGVLTTVQMDLLLGNGDGTFKAAVAIQPQGFVGFNVVTADFDGDGNPDLATDSYVAGSEEAASATVQVMLGDGKGGFSTASSYRLPGAVLAGRMLVADVNRDGKPDLIASSANGPDANELVAYLTVLTGNGDGTFKQLPSITESTEVYGLAAADFRGAGLVDLVEEFFPAAENAQVLSVSSITMAIRPGNGDGTFQAPQPVSPPSILAPLWFDMVAQDFNDDGLPDLAFTASPSDAQVSAGGKPGAGAGIVAAAYQNLPPGDLIVMLSNLPTPPPAIALSQAQVQFTAPAGGSSVSQAVSISNSGRQTLHWTATSSTPWLAFTPGVGVAPDSITITATPGSMTPNTYTGTISLAGTGASNSPQTISVSFTVTAPTNLPVITSVLNGASFLPGFESGSWVTIKGANLSNTNPGRIWTSSEIVNGNLPTALDNTSVTIDGQPAFVYYISPTQINVQAPNDAATGPVNVIVTNNSQSSAAFTAQLQAVAPALFQYSNTSYAIATRYPDNALLGNPSGVPGTIAAKPGDVLILWATGFGPTNPPTSAGMEVVGAPGVATLPAVTVGGVSATVIGAALSPGSAGLYQVAIQLPPNVPTGAVVIQASVGNVMSPAGVLTFIASQ